MLGDQDRGNTARALLANRACRKRYFPSDLFDEHAWDMLLTLFAELTENATLSRARLIASVGVREESGRRWIAHLIQDGQIMAANDGDDITLTADAITRMRSYLDDAVDGQGLIQGQSRDSAARRGASG